MASRGGNQRFSRALPVFISAITLLVCIFASHARAHGLSGAPAQSNAQLLTAAAARAAGADLATLVAGAEARVSAATSVLPARGELCAAGGGVAEARRVESVARRQLNDAREGAELASMALASVRELRAGGSELDSGVLYKEASAKVARGQALMRLDAREHWREASSLYASAAATLRVRCSPLPPPASSRRLRASCWCCSGAVARAAARPECRCGAAN